MSKEVVCEAGCHPITFATQKSLHNTEDATKSTAGEIVCVAMRVCGGIGFNIATKS